jgi:ABC-type uncharacterized transport system involved in gliding motility auxiliary subunit
MMRRSPAGLTALGLALAAILFISINVLSARILGGATIDLTDQGLYTLSQGTKNILHKIDEPIDLKFYYSPKLGEVAPSYGIYAQNVRTLLQRYASIADGKIRLQILDPEPFSATEDAATQAGLQGVRTEASGEQLYFGLVATNSTDDQKTIPFFQLDRERFLEYDVSKLIQDIAFPRKKVVGLLTALPLDNDPFAEMQGRRSHPQAIMDLLRETYDVHDLPQTLDTVPDDVDVLMIVQPQKLTPKTEYAIDQFVLRGGRALVFADPNSDFEAAHRSPMSPQSAGTAAEFGTLFKAWGVQPIKGKLVADRLAAHEVGGSGPESAPVDYLLWLDLKGDDLNPTDPVTAKLSDVDLLTAGALEPAPHATTKFDFLLRTSTDSDLYDASRVAGVPVPDFTALLNDFKSHDRRYTIAARITGTIKTAFPDGPPKDKDQKTASKSPPQLKTSNTPVNLIVVADTDMLDDRFWIEMQDFAGREVGTPFAGNGDFVANAIDSLIGSANLMQLRGRGSAVRPFTAVDAIKHEAEDRYRTQEQALQSRLKDIEAKLASIKPPSDGTDTVQLTPEQETAVSQFQGQMAATRAQLRQVQLALRQDIDRLKNRLVFFDVILVPALVAGIALLLGVGRVRRRTRRTTA